MQRHHRQSVLRAVVDRAVGHETEAMRRLRRENLAGLTGRVLEVGAGTGTNFAFYPATVTEVVAVEPERRLAAQAQRGGRLGGCSGDRHRRPSRG